MRKPTVLVLLLLAGVATSQPSVPAAAQIYPVEVRPSGLSYRVARSAHFDLIYQAGHAREAAEVGAVMEKSLARASELVGTRRRTRVPVILDAYSDRSNGFVATFPFRMDIEVPPIRGNGLSPRNPSWLNTVGRHELVHAAHAEYGSGFGLVGLVRLLSPDMARSLNLSVPAGAAEGIAVHLESEGENRPGRMNHSFFQMEFRAAIAGRRPWSLAQMLERPRYSLPGDRFYHGGSYLYRHLYEADGGTSFRRAQQFHYVFPFLGYGLELWYGAGRPPWKLGRDFRLTERQKELERQVRLGPITEPADLVAGRGRVHRRPQWISDAEVVAFATGYYSRPGFYRYDVDTGRGRRISAERITEDAYFIVSADREHLTFSRYHSDALIPNRFVAEVHRIELSTGSSTRISHDGHAFGAAPRGDGETWAVTHDGQYSRLVILGDTPRFPAVPLWSRTIVRTMAWSPAGDVLAALVNRDGYQGIVLIRESSEGYGVEPLLVSRESSILDFSWFPDGRGLLFSADAEDVANLYAYDLAEGSVTRLTNARYGAFEGSVSPDGSRVAYIDYQHESWRLVAVPITDLDPRPVPRQTFSATGLFEDPPRDRSIVPDTLEILPSRPYRAARYLAPRGLLPIFGYDATPTNPGDVDLGLALGAVVTGSDPLQRWSYVIGGYHQADRLWGSFNLQTGASIVRPAISVFRVPSTRLVRSDGGIRRVGWEEQGVSMSATLPVALTSNVYRSTMLLRLGGELSRDRFFDAGESLPSVFTRRARLVPTVVANLGTHATRRDLRHSSGATVGVTSTVDLWSDEERRRALLANVRIFSRSIPGTGGSLSLFGGFLWQNRPAVYNLDLFLPRGLEDTFLDRGSFVKYGVDLVQPLVYVDDGWLLLPVFLHAVYAYGFAESVKSTSDFSLDFDSVGGGIGLQMRLLHTLGVDIRFGAAYHPDTGETTAVFR